MFGYGGYQSPSMAAMGMLANSGMNMGGGAYQFTGGFTPEMSPYFARGNSAAAQAPSTYNYTYNTPYNDNSVVNYPAFPQSTAPEAPAWQPSPITVGGINITNQQPMTPWVGAEGMAQQQQQQQQPQAPQWQWTSGNNAGNTVGALNTQLPGQMWGYYQGQNPNNPPSVPSYGATNINGVSFGGGSNGRQDSGGSSGYTSVGGGNVGGSVWGSGIRNAWG